MKQVALCPEHAPHHWRDLCHWQAPRHPERSEGSPDDGRVSLLRKVGWLLLGIVVYSYALPGHAEALYPFDRPQQVAQFEHLIADLRCPVCQNQNVADSNALMAKTLRDEVYRSVQTGQSDDEIMRAMQARYGDFISFKPPVKSVTMVLWFGPMMLLIGGVMIFYFTCIKRR